MVSQLGLAYNLLCGVDRNGRGTYTAEGITAIADALRVNSSLTSLDLENNQLCGVPDFGRGYRGYRGTYNAEGITAIADALRVNGVLTKCKLKKNQLGVPGWTAIFNALCDSPTSKIVEWDLRYESLRFASLEPEIAKPLAEYISATGSLTSLSIGDYNLGDDGVEALSIGLKESKSLATLDLSNSDHRMTRFGPKGAAALASAIAVVAGSLTEVCSDPQTTFSLYLLRQYSSRFMLTSVSLCLLARSSTSAGMTLARRVQSHWLMPFASIAPLRRCASRTSNACSPCFHAQILACCA